MKDYLEMAGVVLLCAALAVLGLAGVAFVLCLPFLMTGLALGSLAGGFAAAFHIVLALAGIPL